LDVHVAIHVIHICAISTLGLQLPHEGIVSLPTATVSAVPSASLTQFIFYSKLQKWFNKSLICHKPVSLKLAKLVSSYLEVEQSNKYWQITLKGDMFSVI